MASQVKQGQTLSLTTTETEVTFAGYSQPQGSVIVIVVSGSFQYTVGPAGGGPLIADTGYATVTTAGTSRMITVPTGQSLRLKGAATATVEITW